MITLIVNGDKTVTMTLTGNSQTFFDQLLVSHGLLFIQEFFNSHFTQLSRRVVERNKEDLKRKYDQLPPAKKQQIDDLLEGRV